MCCHKSKADRKLYYLGHNVMSFSTLLPLVNVTGRVHSDVNINDPQSKGKVLIAPMTNVKEMLWVMFKPTTLCSL